MANKELVTKTHTAKTHTARQAAFYALVAWNQNQVFIDDSLDHWKKSQNPQIKDFNLAYELACGTARMQRYLDCIGSALSDKKKLPKKAKERILVEIALYQCYFLDKVPSYAIADEMVTLAKRTTSERFAQFLNAIIRKATQNPPAIPQNLALRYSYTDFFVQSLLSKHEKATVESVLKSQNAPAPFMARLRFKPKTPKDIETHSKASKTTQTPSMLIFDDKIHIKEVALSPCFYIQNITQPHLISLLAQKLSKPPKTILDLCAAPGGKTVFLHDLFPDAELTCNDISEKKLSLLRENLEKYGIQATIQMGRGETLSQDKKFDLIVIDAPCSASGALYKCAEARWRITEDAISKLQNEQLSLIKAAQAHLSPNGVIWYLTCSILPQENEDVIARACKELKFQSTSFSQLPNEQGYEGGFASVLTL